MANKEELTEIMVEAQKRAKKLGKELQRRAREGKINPKKVQDLVEKYIKNTTGVGMMDVVGTDPAIHAAVQFLYELAEGKHPDAPYAIHVVAVDGKEVGDQQVDSFQRFFLALTLGVYLSEVGLAKLLLREVK